MAAVSAVVLVVAAAAPAGTPTLTRVRVPRADPEELALGPDGSVWATGEYGGVIRLDPRGRVRSYAIGPDVYGSDLTAGPNGAMWIAADEEVVELDASGARRSWAVPAGGLARGITSAGGALWLTNESEPDRISRLRTDGSIRSFTVRGPRKNAAMGGIAAAPDGSLWFTQNRYEPKRRDGIGRMTTDGRSSSWALPPRATPLRIAAGPDGALWFTEQDGHAIGRITTSGSITQFPLSTGLSPSDIKAGPDGALWFTADGCIGRLTTSGAVSSWPVTRVGRLVGIAPAPDGSVWAADDLDSVLWHFVPPADGAGPPKPCTPPSITRKSHATRATLVYRRELRLGRTDWFTDPRVRIVRGGEQRFAETVPPLTRLYTDAVWGDTSSFALRDLDGDGEPEVLLELNSNGAHCCAWSRIYGYDSSRRRYVPVVHLWGDDAGSPRVRDLNGDGRPEFDSVDSRFAYAFTSYAGSWFPIEIWSYRHRRFRDVTRRFPQQVRRDAARAWRFYVRHRSAKGETVRGVLAAWAADEYLLGRSDDVWRTLEREARAGYLSCKRGCFLNPSSPHAYMRKLRAFLRRLGYAR